MRKKKVRTVYFGLQILILNGAGLQILLNSLLLNLLLLNGNYSIYTPSYFLVLMASWKSDGRSMHSENMRA